jgi:hypothetical protein
MVADFMNRHSDRFLFGTDEVTPSSEEKLREARLLQSCSW